MPPSEAGRSLQHRLRRHLGDLWPSRTSRNADPTPGWLSSGCLSGCQTGMPSANCRCHLFDVAPPPLPLPPCLGRMTITAEEDKGESVFTETSRHETPPVNMSFTWPLNRFPNHIICTTVVLTISYCSTLVRARHSQHAIWHWYQQLIKQSYSNRCFWMWMMLLGIRQGSIWRKCVLHVRQQHFCFFFDWCQWVSRHQGRPDENSSEWMSYYIQLKLRKINNF